MQVTFEGKPVQVIGVPHTDSRDQRTQMPTPAELRATHRKTADQLLLGDPAGQQHGQAGERGSGCKLRVKEATAGAF